MSDIYNALKRPFPANQISWRCGATNRDKTKGIALAYIDARDVMRRFDEVFGLEWQNRYSHAEGKTICEIGAKIGGEWVWRAGGAGDTDIEAEKGAISDAFKRAAVLWGVGRYLYELPNEWVEIDEYKKLKRQPALPRWATPEGFDAIVAGKEEQKRTAGMDPSILADWITHIESSANVGELRQRAADAEAACKEVNDDEALSKVQAAAATKAAKARKHSTPA
jgi:hypothetical protein